MQLSSQHIENMVKKGVWSAQCPIHYTRLRVLELPYYDFNGNTRKGAMVVLDTIEDNVRSIFEELYRRKFPIERMELLENFNGNDVSSMEANNTSGFNGRRIMNTKRWSSHAYGVAIDVNPRQNPYLRFNREASNITVYPSGALTYVNRNVRRPGMVEHIVEVFAEFGFTEWGGNWETKPDYHHFQLPWERIRQLFPGMEEE